jgi:hypothetical protein
MKGFTIEKSSYPGGDVEITINYHQTVGIEDFPRKVTISRSKSTNSICITDRAASGERDARSSINIYDAIIPQLIFALQNFQR